MPRYTKEQAYKDHLFDKTLTRSYGVDRETFETLKTCGVGENSAQIKDKETKQVVQANVSPWLSTWFLQGDDLKFLLQEDLLKKHPLQGEKLETLLKANPITDDEFDTRLKGKLCNNIVLLGLNAGSMDKVTPPWYFFHYRYKKGTTQIKLTASEKNLKKYLTECHLPFEGAYITDILKFQDEDRTIYVEPESGNIKTTAKIREYNFKFLEKELQLLHSAAPASEKMLLVPMGNSCFALLKSFLVWLHKTNSACKDWVVVPENYMLHYSSRGWTEPDYQYIREAMIEWCENHIS